MVLVHGGAHAGWVWDRVAGQATRWTVPVDLAAVHARYLFFPALGHTDVLVKETGWQEVATAVEEWLRASG